jgi:hypothetical protein
MCYTLKGTYLVSKTSLEYWSILFRPFLSNESMVCTQLEQIAKQRNTRDLGEILNLGDIRRVEVSNREKNDKNSYTEYYRRSHIQE